MRSPGLAAAEISAARDGGDVVLSLADGTSLRVAGHLTVAAPDESFGFVSSDARAEAGLRVTLVIEAVDDAPVVAVPLPDRSVAPGAPVGVFLPEGAFADPEGDPLTLSARLAGGAKVPFRLDFDGIRLAGFPPPGFAGALGIAVTASDTFTLAIEGDGPPPAAERTVSFATIARRNLDTLDDDILTVAEAVALPGSNQIQDRNFYAILGDGDATREEGETAYKLADMGNGARVLGLGLAGTSAAPVAISAHGRINNTTIGDPTSRVRYEADASASTTARTARRWPASSTPATVSPSHRRSDPSRASASTSRSSTAPARRGSLPISTAT